MTRELIKTISRFSCYKDLKLLLDADNDLSVLGSLYYSVKANKLILTVTPADDSIAARNLEVISNCSKYNNKFSVDDFKLIFNIDD